MGDNTNGQLGTGGGELLTVPKPLDFSDSKSLIIPSHSFIRLENQVQLENFEFMAIAKYELYVENVTVVIKPINTPIIAFIVGGDRRVSETDTIILDGSGSFDPDNTTEVISYR